MENRSDVEGAIGRGSEQAFDRELGLVEGALALVAGGAAPRVTLVGLNGGARLARLAMELGARAGVAVHAWRHGAVGNPADERFDLSVEQNG